MIRSRAILNLSVNPGRQERVRWCVSTLDRSNSRQRSARAQSSLGQVLPTRHAARACAVTTVVGCLATAHELRDHRWELAGVRPGDSRRRCTEELGAEVTRHRTSSCSARPRRPRRAVQHFFVARLAKSHESARSGPGGARKTGRTATASGRPQAVKRLPELTKNDQRRPITSRSEGVSTISPQVKAKAWQTYDV
jgi:hypothetical protein